MSIMGDGAYMGSLCDTDLYKLTMGYCINQHFGKAEVTYELKLRSKVTFTAADAEKIGAILMKADRMTFKPQSLEYLQKVAGFYLSEQYITFLKGLRLDPTHVQTVGVDAEGNLQVVIRGPWWHTVYWEIHVLSLVSQWYYENYHTIDTKLLLEIAYDRAYKKAKALKEMGANFVDFGTRRRRSLNIQRAVLEGLADGGGANYLGTSNVMLAAETGTKIHGTMAHEMFSAVAAMYGVENANNIVLGKWVDTYRGNLGIALPDTFTTDFFLRTYDTFYSRLFDGVRHDSGCPIEFADKYINHMAKLNIPCRDKRIVFSDSINSLELVEQIVKHCTGKVGFAFGIGTWFTNDFDDVPALNMVMKVVEAKKNPQEPRRKAVKLSDVPGKHNGCADTVQDYIKRITMDCA